MKLLSLAAFCSIAVLTCADYLKDASSLKKENGDINHAENARSLSSPDILEQDNRIGMGSKLTSPSGRFHLDMQYDGNLVLYRTDDNKPIWHSDTWARDQYGNGGGLYAILQKDGNFVVYAPGQRPTWASKTVGRGDNYVRVQDDGNLVIYTKGTNAVQWASGTDWARPGKATNLRTQSLNATHVISSFMTMLGDLPHALVKIAHFGKDPVSVDGDGGVGVDAPDQASNIILDGTGAK